MAVTNIAGANGAAHQVPANIVSRAIGNTAYAANLVYDNIDNQSQEYLSFIT